jgi:hypothetical protein
MISLTTISENITLSYIAYSFDRLLLQMLLYLILRNLRAFNALCAIGGHL